MDGGLSLLDSIIIFLNLYNLGAGGGVSFILINYLNFFIIWLNLYLSIIYSCGNRFIFNIGFNLSYLVLGPGPDFYNSSNDFYSGNNGSGPIYSIIIKSLLLSGAYKPVA